MTAYLAPYNIRSRSAKFLSEALAIRRIKPDNSEFTGNPSKIVFNWGRTELSEEVNKCTVYNKQSAVSRCVNKLTFFQFCKAAADGPRVPPFTTSAVEALNWSKTRLVVARTKLTARSGAGIVFLDSDTDEFINAPMYTAYVKKKSEFRIHFAFGEMIGQQKKVLRETDEDGNPVDKTQVDFRIRNAENGFIFQRNDIFVPQDVIRQARKAYLVSRLDYGGVDVIYNESEDQAYVLEINTAPGIEGTTVEEYVDAFRTKL